MWEPTCVCAFVPVASSARHISRGLLPLDDPDESTTFIIVCSPCPYLRFLPKYRVTKETCYCYVNAVLSILPLPLLWSGHGDTRGCHGSQTSTTALPLLGVLGPPPIFVQLFNFPQNSFQHRELMQIQGLKKLHALGNSTVN